MKYVVYYVVGLLILSAAPALIMGLIFTAGIYYFLYCILKGITSGSSSSGGGGSSSSSSSGGGAPDNAVYLSFLKVTQQGNKLTMTSDRGMVYKGQITGASTSKDGYVAAQQVRLSFEVTSATGNMKITGHFSGAWSGAADKQYGVLSERTIQGTHNRAGNFVGVAADATIKVPDITISEVGVNSVGE